MHSLHKLQLTMFDPRGMLVENSTSASATGYHSAKRMQVYVDLCDLHYLSKYFKALQIFVL